MTLLHTVITDYQNLYAKNVNECVFRSSPWNVGRDHQRWVPELRNLFWLVHPLWGRPIHQSHSVLHQDSSHLWVPLQEQPGYWLILYQSERLLKACCEFWRRTCLDRQPLGPEKLKEWKTCTKTIKACRGMRAWCFEQCIIAWTGFLDFVCTFCVSIRQSRPTKMFCCHRSHMLKTPHMTLDPTP